MEESVPTRDELLWQLGDLRRQLEDLQELEEVHQRTEQALRLDEARLQALVQLHLMTAAPLQQITDFALEAAVTLTNSKIGYLAFVNEDESVLTMHSWSKTAMSECAIIDKPIHYPVATTGLWGEAVRQRRPVITNDYPAPNPLKKGYPPGHIAVLRHMNAPIFDGERIVVVAGVGNKAEPYDDSDVRQLTLLMQGMWQLLQRQRSEEQLRQARAELEARVQERTAELGAANAELERIAEALRISQERLRLMEDLATDGMWDWNLTTNEEYLSPRWKQMFGYADHELANHASTWQSMIFPEDLQLALKAFDDHIHHGKPFQIPVRYRHKDGSTVWILCRGVALKDKQGRYDRMIGTHTNITPLKNIEDALRFAKEEAEAASLAKSTFLANMSHEIRTPLNAILGMTELVLKSPLSAQQREFLATVHDSGEALLSVINDILDFSKIEAGKLVLDRVPFDLRESLGDTLKSFSLRAYEQGLELACYVHPDVPHLVVGDYNRLRQVIVNLVGNALKFTEQGEVVVEVARESQTARRVTLHFGVSDTGIGIPVEKQQSIFGMFEQADSSTTRRHGGTGLGLAIAKRLLELMGSRLWLESDVGRGSHFHFVISLELADGEPEEYVPPEPACLHGTRVLVVDDNATNRRIEEEVLRSWHMRPLVAASASDGLQILLAGQERGEPFPLVLTDAHMPEMDGFMLSEQIRQHPTLKNTVVVMLTSGDRPEDAKRCQELGIAAYLLKPFKQSELLEAIEVALGVSVPHRESPPSEPATSAVGSLHVLLAEDSLVNQKLALALLQGKGHRVTIVTNGREAIDALQADSIDLVLMDIQMPEMDGLEASRTIRKLERPEHRRVPIIAMTAHALKGDCERCLAAGMDGYVSKPIRSQELFRTIDAVWMTSQNARRRSVREQRSD